MEDWNNQNIRQRNKWLRNLANMSSNAHDVNRCVLISFCIYYYFIFPFKTFFTVFYFYTSLCISTSACKWFFILCVSVLHNHEHLWHLQIIFLCQKQNGWSLCLPAALCIRHDSSSSRCVVLFFLVSTSFPLLPLLRLLQRRCRDAFPLLLLLQAAERVRIALFPLPLPPPPLSVLLVDALLLLQAADALLLRRADQLAQLDCLDVVEGRLAGLVQHDGVLDDVEQRNAGDLLQACS